ncbi:MAG: DPP IV N-terminal domain-containing protein [Bacteroidales bacterium]|nr:DPP IV N-terminal domain-containing protein [Bacteroidales bacterium]
MKSLRILFLIFFIFIEPVFSFRLDAQPQRGSGGAHRVTGWIDDTHFIFQTYDSENRPVTLNVDVKSGKSIPYTPPKTPEEILNESLPAGIKLGRDDILSPDGVSAVLIKEKDLYFFKPGFKELRRLTSDPDEEVNTRFSPDGLKLAYTKNKDLYVYDLVSFKEIRLTKDATDRIYNGYASWVYMEEILGRSSRYAAFWWSPDSKRIAFLRTDETQVPVFTLNRLDEPDGIHGKLEVTPYPKAGDPNPKVRMGIADITNSSITWVKTDDNIDQYIAWPFWKPDGSRLAIQVLNRDQNDMRFILADPATGNYTEIYSEKRNSWVDFFEDIYVMKNGSGFIVRSYKTDWENLYLYGWDGRLVSQITNVEWRINGISRVDEDAKLLYFTGTGPESTDYHFFRVGLDGKNLIQITEEPGTHVVTISPKGSYFIDTWNNINTPGSIVAYDKKGRLVREIYKFEEYPFDPARNSRSEMVKIMTSDGLFNMPAIITYPVNFDETRKYPVVFTIYGGPGSANVINRWQGNNPSWYAQNGIITFTVDHRGSGHFGKKGMDYLYRNLGKWEILDYADAVKWLRTKYFVDSEKVGITGSSYGGYMTCLALTKGADYWTHGFAGSSVTDWRLYDNVYTERYMDKPEDNPEGYKEGSTLTFVKNYKGKLYLNHGDIDDNVHMQNSIYLISKLQDEGKTFQFMLYPDARHGWGGAKALHTANERNNFWLSNFFGKQ